MGQLAPARFKTNHKASGGLYAGQGYVDIAHKKIKDKREFILGTNAQGRKVYGLSFYEDIKINLERLLHHLYQT